MITIRGIQEAQQDNNQRIAALQPGGSFGRAIQYATAQAHRYALIVTHVQTGALRGSHRMKVSGTRGEIYIDPNSVNPKGAKPSIYGPVEHNRGGTHAFYRRVYDEHGAEIARTAGQIFAQGALLK